MNLLDIHKEKEQTIQEIQEKQPEIIEMVNKKLENITARSDVKDFLYVFLGNIKKCINEERYMEIVNQLLSENSIRKLVSIRFGHEFSFSYNSDFEIISFDRMLKKQVNKHGKQYIADGVEHSYKNINEEDNLIDGFIRYLAITNFQDLYCEEAPFNSVEHLTERYECLLDGYAVGRVQLEYPENPKDDLKPDMLKIRNGLKGAKIGQVLLKYLISMVHHKYPNKSLISHTVLKKNTPAIKLYKRMGGIFYEHKIGQCCSVKFDKSKFSEIEKMVIEPPKLKKDEIINQGLTNKEEKAEQNDEKEL